MGILPECPKCHYMGSARLRSCKKCSHNFGGSNEKGF